MFLWWILPTAHFLNAPNTHESDSLSVDSCVSNGRQTSAEPCVPPTKHTQILLKNDKLTAHSSPVFIHSKHRSHSIWIPACGVSRCGMQCSSSSSHSSPCTQWCHFLFERLFTAIKGNFGYLQAQRSMCSHTHPVQLQLSSGREGLFSSWKSREYKSQVNVDESSSDTYVKKTNVWTYQAWWVWLTFSIYNRSISIVQPNSDNL